MSEKNISIYIYIYKFYITYTFSKNIYECHIKMYDDYD